MSKKSKGVLFYSTPSYGIGMYEDTKAMLKHQTLMQEYEELQKESDAMRSKLEAAKQRKLILAAEVGFLRRRYKYLVKAKSVNSSHEPSLVQVPNMCRQTKLIKEQPLIRKEASQRRSKQVLEPNSKKKRQVKQGPQRHSTPLTEQSHKKLTHGGKEAKGHGFSLLPPLVSDLSHNGIPMTLVLDRNHKERMLVANDANSRHSAAFDLNQDDSTSAPSGKEASLPSRAPIFDLNEISTGDDDFQGDVEAIKFEEAKKSLIRGINDEQQSDLKLSVCRNAGESSSRSGKRKISWQDPVALRV